MTTEAVVQEAVEAAEPSVEEEPVEDETVARETVRFVSQNILHGVGCSLESDSCAVTERVALFMKQLLAARCPELVSVQEANERIVGLIEAGG